jgi:hypothetical protein
MDDQAQNFDLDDSGTNALAIAAGGAAALVLGWILGSRLLRMAGLLAAIAGGGLYARRKLAERQQRIGEAEDLIRSELDDLDPVARAQVIEGIVTS